MRVSSVRNDVPGGAEGWLVPPAGVERAGGSPGRVLVEQLRAAIRALEQVPVSLAVPPVPGAAPPRPACSLPYREQSSFSAAEGRPLPLPPCGGARSVFDRSEGGEQHIPNLLLTPLPALPHKGGGGACVEPAISSHPFSVPLHKLKQGGLHEIRAASYRDGPAALTFALAVIAEQAARAKRRDLVLWCLTRDAAREWGRPYGPGLGALGLDPALILVVEARNAQDAAWALEEGLKSRALLAALAQIEIKAPLIARRLGLAAQASRTPCLLISSHQQQPGSPGTGLPGTLTRWRIAASGSGAAPFDAQAPGAPSWRLTLERCRGEAPGRNFIVEFSHESFCVRLAAASSDRAAEAGENGEKLRADTGQVRTG
jgi:protein ImuA